MAGLASTVNHTWSAPSLQFTGMQRNPAQLIHLLFDTEIQRITTQAPPPPPPPSPSAVSRNLPSPPLLSLSFFLPLPLSLPSHIVPPFSPPPAEMEAHVCFARQLDVMEEASPAHITRSRPGRGGRHTPDLMCVSKSLAQSEEAYASIVL